MKCYEPSPTNGRCLNDVDGNIAVTENAQPVEKHCLVQSFLRELRPATFDKSGCNGRTDDKRVRNR